jgi:hypothetical protein
MYHYADYFIAVHKKTVLFSFAVVSLLLFPGYFKKNEGIISQLTP